MNLSIYGHASISIFIYTINGVYREQAMYGGLLFIKEALLALQRQDQPAEPVNDATLFINEKLDRNSDVYLREFKELGCYIDDKNRSYYAVSRHLGSCESKSGGNIYTFPPARADIPADLIIWDEGFGGLLPPEGCATAIWASNKALPDREQFAKISDRCFLFLDAGVLRSAGAMVSRQISWERTASELIWQLQNNPAISYLMKAKNILILFAEDGAVHINNSSGRAAASLILTHGGAEGSLRERRSGRFDDTFALMTITFAVLTLFPSLLPDEVSFEPLRMVLETGEEFVLSGYKISDNLDDMVFNITPKAKKWAAFTIPLMYKEDLNQVYVKDDWTITDSVGDKRLYDVAFEYVVKGAEVIEGLPQLSLGAFTTIDRWEIEAYQNIRNLIIGYANGESTSPLSIAVFGSPGSGKSFGVTQIAQNVLPGRVEKLEFNVSQFTSLADLGNAFQKVRDTVLCGKLPLVFFDEFDSDRDGMPLGWVKSFLMPMQDGKFRDESGEHPLGRCILVFAGGTASSFDEFAGPMKCECEVWTNEADIKAHDYFRNIKGPDFISRLRGTINVMGPNQKNGDDKNFILRRALLLRSLCERKLKFGQNPPPVSRDIIRAMLLVPEYRHGARSMEAILDMSRIDGGVGAGIPSLSFPAFASCGRRCFYCSCASKKQTVNLWQPLNT